MIDALFITLALLAYVKLLFIYAVPLPRTAMSTFELERRVKDGNEAAQAEQRRRELTPLLQALFSLTAAIFAVGFAALLIATFGWVYGVLVSMALLILLNPLGRVAFIQKLGLRLYKWQEEHLHAMVSYKYVRPVLHALRGRNEVKEDAHVDSRAELEHVIKHSGNLLGKKEQQLLLSTFEFSNAIVHEVFTPRKKVMTVDKKEVLGPKLLDELHHTGQNCFPVVEGSFDTVVGILPAHDIMNTQRQGKLTAEKAMVQPVVVLQEGESLESALRALLRERQYCGIVVNNLKENIGVITIDDIIAALLGPAH